MIRRSDGTRTDELANIWLDVNLEAHSFVPADYWISRRDAVRNAFAEAEVFYWEENGSVRGFIGLLADGYIAGLFVSKAFRSQGIGRRLIEEVERRYPTLTLNVFVKNRRAVSFYQKLGFRVEKEALNDEFGESEFLMKRKNESRNADF